MNSRLRRTVQTLLVALATVIGVVLSVASYYFLDELRKSRVEWNLNEDAHAYISALRRTFDKKFEVLNSYNAFFHASSLILRKNFRQFATDMLMDSPDFHALEWAPRVPYKARRGYELLAQNDGLPDFRIFERNEKGEAVPSPRRDVYFPVYYAISTKGGSTELGFDLEFDLKARLAMEQAAATGTITFSEISRPAAEHSGKNGFRIFKPVYVKGSPHTTPEERRKNLEGFIIGKYYVVDFHRELLKLPLPSGLEMHLFTGVKPSEDNFIHTHSMDAASLRAPVRTVKEVLAGDKAIKLFPVGGQQWTVVISPTETYTERGDNWLPMMAMSGGVMLTLLLTFFLHSTIGRAAETERMVEERTEELHEEIHERKLAEMALKQSQSSLLKAQRIAKLGSWERDLKTGKLYWSDQHFRIFGYDPGEVEPTFEALIDLVHPEDRKVFLDAHKLAQAGNDRYDSEYKIIRPDGMVSVIHSQAIIVRDEHETPVRMSGTVLDITERKMAEEKERQAHQIQNVISGLLQVAMEPGTLKEQLDKSLDLLFSLPWFALQARGSIFLANEKERTLTLVSERNLSKPLLAFCREVPFGRCMCGRAAESRKIVYCGRMDERHEITYDGIQPHGHFCVPIVSASRLLGVLNLYIEEDTPFDSDTEETLHAIANTLASLVERKEKDEELVNAMQAADQANKAKGNFLANMSHEIRTPMNAIVGMSHLALKTELTPKQHDYLSKIQGASETLLGIINDILDISKIEAGKLEVEFAEFSLDKVLNNLSVLVGHKACEKGLELIFSRGWHVPDSLVGDSLRLGQILTNLANNAVKFTDQGEIVISVELVGETTERAMLRFTVKDTEIGLSREQCAKLFQPFSQADASTTRKYGGSGLGLAISKQLVELMGGEIGLESALGEGSSFFFTADFGVGAEESLEHHLPSPGYRGKRILVVDDNEASRDILMENLISMSFKVSTAASGADAIAELQRASGDPHVKPYDLILMDWKMPGMDGFEAARRIRANPHLKAIPTIVMVTAHGREEVLSQVNEADLDGFLLKPVTPSILLNTIVRAFGHTTADRRRFPRSPSQAAKAVQRLAGANILLAEDNEINQQVAIELLEGNGLRVTVVNDGLEALAAVNEQTFDLVLMDIQMPGMDGYQATTEIRADSRFKDLPIVAMTAHALGEEKQKCLSVGMNDHIAKPVDPDILFMALLKWIKSENNSPPSQAKPVNMDCAGELPPTLAGFDLEEGLERMQGNAKLYKQLLRSFHKSKESAAAEIKEAVAQGDFSAASDLAHALKGVAGNLSANGLFEICKAVEAAAKRQDAQELESLLDAFERSHGEVMQSLGGLLRKKPEEADCEDGDPIDVAPLDADKIAPLLKDLAVRLKSKDLKAGALIASLKGLMGAAASRKEMKSLEECIEDLDFTGAMEPLEQIAQSLNVSLED